MFWLVLVLWHSIHILGTVCQFLLECLLGLEDCIETIDHFGDSCHRLVVQSMNIKCLPIYVALILAMLSNSQCTCLLLSLLLCILFISVLLWKEFLNFGFAVIEKDTCTPMLIAVLFIIARAQTGCVGCTELDTTEVIYHTQHAQDMEAT